MRAIEELRPSRLAVPRRGGKASGLRPRIAKFAPWPPNESGVAHYPLRLGQALRELYDAGLVQRVGISNVDVDQVRTAREVLGDALVSVQDPLGPGHLDDFDVERLRPLDAYRVEWSGDRGLLVQAAPTLAEAATPAGEAEMLRLTETFRAALHPRRP